VLKRLSAAIRVERWLLQLNFPIWSCFPSWRTQALPAAHYYGFHLCLIKNRDISMTYHIFFLHPMDK